VIKFLDGPAAGQCLALRRAPIFLRVVVNRYGDKKTWDALDQLGDTPKAGEDIFAYRLASQPRHMHLCRSPRRLSGYYAMADYRFVGQQPDDATLRNADKWRAWCIEQAKAEGLACSIPEIQK